MDPHKAGSLNQQPPPAHNMSGPSQYPPPQGMPMGQPMQPGYNIPRPAHTSSQVSMSKTPQTQNLTQLQNKPMPVPAASSPKPQAMQNPVDKNYPMVASGQKLPTQPISHPNATNPGNNKVPTGVSVSNAQKQPLPIPPQHQPYQQYHNMQPQRPPIHQFPIPQHQTALQQPINQTPHAVPIPYAQPPAVISPLATVAAVPPPKPEVSKAPVPPMPGLISITKPPSTTQPLPASNPPKQVEVKPSNSWSNDASSIKAAPVALSPIPKTAQPAGASLSQAANKSTEAKPPNVSITPAKAHLAVPKVDSTKPALESIGNTVTITPKTTATKTDEVKPSTIDAKLTATASLNGVPTKSATKPLVVNKVEGSTAPTTAAKVAPAQPAAVPAKSCTVPAPISSTSVPVSVPSKPTTSPAPKPSKIVTSVGGTPLPKSQNCAVSPAPAKLAPVQKIAAPQPAKSADVPASTPSVNSTTSQVKAVPAKATAAPATPNQSNKTTVAAKSLSPSTKPIIPSSTSPPKDTKASPEKAKVQPMHIEVQTTEAPSTDTVPEANTRAKTSVSQSPKGKKAKALKVNSTPEKLNNAPVEETPQKREPRNKRKNSDTPSEGERKSKRSRAPANVYQSPAPEHSLRLPKNNLRAAATPDKLVLFFKNEHVALRNAEGTFFICQLVQNVYKTTPKIKIRWLSPIEKTESAETYSPDYYDHTDLDCILTSVSLKRLSRTTLELPNTERTRITNILQRALDRDKGIVHDNSDVMEDHPDGLDISLYNDEAQLQQKKSRKRRKPSQESEESDEEDEEESVDDDDEEEDENNEEDDNNEEENDNNEEEENDNNEEDEDNNEQEDEEEVSEDDNEEENEPAAKKARTVASKGRKPRVVAAKPEPPIKTPARTPGRRGRPPAVAKATPKAEPKTARTSRSVAAVPKDTPKTTRRSKK